MKRYILILFIALLSNFQVANSQVKVSAGDIIKDESGKVINFETYNKPMASGDWNYVPSKDKDGKSYFQLKRMSDFEREFRAKILKQQSVQSELIGKKAPDFELTDITGNKITSEDVKGKVVVLNFWFIACKPCIEEIPKLNIVHDKYKDNPNIVFASITFDQKDKVESFLIDTPIKYAVIPDSIGVINSFNIFAYPTNIVIDKNGNFTDITSGGFPEIGVQIDKSINTALKTK